MATPTLTFNSTSGSDTLASGAGPATALTGTNAVTDIAGSVVTLDGSPDLSGVATDGSHVIFLNDSTSGNRNFSSISAADNTAKTVTVTSGEEFGATLSGISWAIGGKRKTCASSSRLFANNSNQNGDLDGGWVVEFESGYTETLTDFTYSAQLTAASQDSPITIRTKSGAATRAKFTTTGNAFIWLQNAYARFTHWVDLDLEYDNASDQSSSDGLIYGNGQMQHYTGLRFTNASTGKYYQGLYAPNANNQRETIQDCFFEGAAGYGIRKSRSGRIKNCYFKDCATAAYVQIYDLRTTIENNIFNNSTTHDLDLDNAFSYAGLLIRNNVFYSTGSNAIDLPTAQSGAPQFENTIENNIFMDIVGTAINLTDEYKFLRIRNNVFYNNGTNSSITDDRFESSNITGTDPGFTDAANDDFSLSAASSVAAAVGWPDTNIGSAQSSTRSYVDIGAAQREEPTGGGAIVNQGLHAIESGITA